MQSTNGNGHHKTNTVPAVTDPIPPQDLDAEKGLLGSLLIDNDAIDRVAGFLKPEHFYRKIHGNIFAAMLALHDKEEPIDLLTLSAKLPTEDIDDLGGFIGLVPTSFNAEAYGRIIEAVAVRRGLIRAAGEIAKMGFDESEDIDDQLAEADAKLTQLRNGRVTDRLPRPREYASEWLDRMDRLRDKENPMLGLPSPWTDLNKLLLGFIPGKVYYVGARPSMGKSALLIALAAHWALDLGKRVYYWSGEMDTNQIMDRIAAERTRTALSKVRLGDLTDLEHAETTRLGAMISDSSLIINDQGGIRPAQLRASCHREHMLGGLDAIMVDYIGLMTPDRIRHNQNEEITETSRSLVSLARSLNVPLIAASQLSRDLEKRADKRPQLSDLRDSGSLEQDGFAVMFLYRDDYYNELSDRPSVAELNVAKHRDGPTGQVDMFWQAQYAAFRNLERANIRF